MTHASRYSPQSPVLVRPGVILPLWIAVAVDESQPAGTYTGEITVVFEGGATSSVGVNLTVAGPSLGDTHGDAEQWRGTRLAWLDSDIAVSGDTVPPPFIPLSATVPMPMVGFDVTMLDKAIRVRILHVHVAVVFNRVNVHHPVLCNNFKHQNHSCLLHA